MRCYNVDKKSLSEFYGIDICDLEKMFNGILGFNYNQLKKTCYLLGIDMKTLLNENKYKCKLKIVGTSHTKVDSYILKTIEKAHFISEFIKTLNKNL